MKSAIRVENLSKHFRIGAADGADYHTLRETIVEAVKGPFRRLRNGGQSERQTDFWALQNVSFDVQPGEVVGIIGRNGAGKSTLLKILSRVMEPTKGRATMHGRMSSLLEVGTGFHPELTGRENIYLNGSILGMSHREIERKFDAIVEFSEIEKFLDTPVKRYSSGMYVRLAFAVAAHLEPEILVVDEVLAVGDAAFQEKCLGKMRESASRGRTVLFVSHNMAAVQQLCDRVIWINGGQVLDDGEPRETVRKYTKNFKRAINASVRDWPDRETNGQARIVNLEVTDLVDGMKGSVAFGSDMRISIDAEFREPVVDPGYGLFIHTIDGEPLLDLRSSHNGVRLGRVEGQMTMTVDVRCLGLHPGEYLLSPWISDSICSVDLDWAKYCSTLRVEPAASNGRAVKLNSEVGRYWVPSTWNRA